MRKTSLFIMAMICITATAHAEPVVCNPVRGTVISYEDVANSIVKESFADKLTGTVQISWDRYVIYPEHVVKMYGMRLRPVPIMSLAKGLAYLDSDDVARWLYSRLRIYMPGVSAFTVRGEDNRVLAGETMLLVGALTDNGIVWLHGDPAFYNTFCDFEM